MLGGEIFGGTRRFLVFSKFVLSSRSDQGNYWKSSHYLPGYTWDIGHCSEWIL